MVKITVQLTNVSETHDQSRIRLLEGYRIFLVLMNNACPILIGSFTILGRKLNQSRAINAYASTKCFRYDLCLQTS